MRLKDIDTGVEYEAKVLGIDSSRFYDLTPIPTRRELLLWMMESPDNVCVEGGNRFRWANDSLQFWNSVSGNWEAIGSAFFMFSPTKRTKTNE